MKKNTINYLMIAGLGIGAYFLFKSKNTYADSTIPTNTPTFTEDVTNAFKDQIVKNRYRFEILGIDTNKTLSIVENLSSGKSSIKEGVTLINDFYKAGVQLPSTSKTIKKNVVAKNIITGKTTTGNIAQLSDGSIKHISISQPERDNQGKTAFDRMIEKNKAKLLKK